jgi:hypothetical protein
MSAASGNLDRKVDIINDWKNNGEWTETSAIKSLGYYQCKEHRARFDEE